MKFGKVLKVSSENMPDEMHDLFLRYKELKKKIKAIPITKEAAAGDEKQASVSPEGSVTCVSGSANGAAAPITATVLSAEEQAFISTLNEDLARFNRYFIEKEEEAVIRLQALCDELAAAVAAAGMPVPAALTAAVTSDPEDAAPPAFYRPHPAPVAQPVQAPAQEARADAPAARAAPAAAPHREQAERTQPEPVAAAAAPPAPHLHPHAAQAQQPPPPPPQQQSALGALQGVKSRLVQFHGEMVLLLHWSLLNYAAVVKILKKHDKRTGVLLRAPYLANVLQQPFSSTTIMSRLAKRAEELVVATTQLGPQGQAQGQGAGPHGAPPGGEGHAQPAADASARADDTAGGSGDEATTAALPPVVRGQEGAAGGAGAAAAGSEVSSLTVAEQGAEAADAEGRAEGPAVVGHHGHAHGGHGHAAPLVGRTMHALETWAQLRKNAITPSTVLAAGEVAEQPAGAAAAAGAGTLKRRAEATPPAELDAAAPAAPAAPAGKLPRAEAPSE